MKLFPTLVFCGFILNCQAQEKTDPSIYANEINAENLKEQLYRIAGPEFEGRETATAGQRKAAHYIQEFFEKHGLTPGNKDRYQLDYPVFIDSLVSAEVRLNGTRFKLDSDFDIRLANAYTLAAGSSEIVFAGYGLSDSLQDDYKDLQVAGKIVLVLNGYPPGQLTTRVNAKMFNSFAKQDAAQQHGALAVLIIQDDFPHKPIPEGGKMYRKYFYPKVHLNSFLVSEKIARTIMGSDYDKAKSGSAENKTYQIDTWISIQKYTSMLQSSNVLGYLEGSDLKDQLLVISAHYDHLGKKDSVIYFGADDDGSGTVGLLELAAAFSKAKSAGAGPRRSVLFLANSGEEKGLWGSEYYTDHPVYPLEKTTADLNIDMIGRSDPKRTQGDSTNYVYVVGDDRLSSELRPINVGMNRKYIGLELDYKFNDPKDPLKIYTRSDHYNFARKGVPIIFYFDGINPDYHRPTDTPDKINYTLMTKRARLVFYTAWEMANRNDMIVRDLPQVKGER